MSFTKDTWGNNVWYLFHTIAEKIKDDEFNNIKDDIFFVIKTVSTNLPCPECSSDANALLNKVDFNNIKNKDDLKTFVFNFHNQVNKKLNKPMFDKELLDTKYANASIHSLYNNFFIIFSSNSNVPQLMSASFHRQHNLPKIRDCLNKILTKID